MFKFAKPRGFLNWKSTLYIKPDVLRMNVGAPCNILFISDIHLRRSHPESMCLIMQACTGLKPDVVLLGGDMAEYTGGVEIICSSLRTAFPDIPIYAVPGNNDEGDRDEQRKLYDGYGIRLLLNECVRTGNLEIAGVEDSCTHTPCSKGLFSDDTGIYRVLLSHAPHSFLLNETEIKPDLMLSGHTHGGQINLFGCTCYLIGYENFYHFTHLAGMKKIGNTKCIVSRGIGVSKYPIRICAKPEIHYLTGSDEL